MKKKVKIHIGSKIKELRKERSMTLVELSEKSGVQVATLSRIEHDKMTGTVEAHAQIALALGIELFQLYSHIRILPKEVRSPKFSGMG